jgi:hypothetical protein
MSSAAVCAIGEDVEDMAKAAPLPLVLVVPVDGHLDRAQVARLLAVFPSYAGGVVTVTIEKAKSKRSVRQNAWLHGVALPLIASHCGYDLHELDRLRYDLLGVCYGTEAIAPLIPSAPPRIVPKRTSSQLSVEEFSEWMAWIVRFAAQELGVIIPLPDEVPIDA